MNKKVITIGVVLLFVVIAFVPTGTAFSLPVQKYSKQEQLAPTNEKKVLSAPNYTFNFAKVELNGKLYDTGGDGLFFYPVWAWILRQEQYIQWVIVGNAGGVCYWELREGTIKFTPLIGKPVTINQKAIIRWEMYKDPFPDNEYPMVEHRNVSGIGFEVYLE